MSVVVRSPQVGAISQSRYVETKVVESFTYTLCLAVHDVDIFASVLIQTKFLTTFEAHNIRTIHGESDVSKVMKLLLTVVRKIESSNSVEDAEETFKRFVTDVLVGALQLVHVAEPMEDKHRE